MANENQQGGGIPNPVQIQKFLGDMKYPANKQTIMDLAKKNGADQQVMDTIAKMPDKTYSNSADISQAMGQM